MAENRVKIKNVVILTKTILRTKYAFRELNQEWNGMENKIYNARLLPMIKIKRTVQPRGTVKLLHMEL